MTLREPVTAEDFERYALLPENAHKRLKLVEGHVIDAGLNWWSSVVNARLSSAVLDYLLNENDIGWVTGPGCGYAVGGERYLPNMAYHCYERFPKPTGEYYPPVAPTIAVEIIMGIPGEEAILGVQLRHYLAAGSTVWIVRPY
ncbi:MAG: Uma2 family endonuclease, partial [Chloroflexota bacterium]